MKKVFLTLVLCLIGVSLSAQNESFTVVGGPVEVFGEGDSWMKVGRGGQISSDSHVRASARFSLRNKRGVSETYSPCDCTLVTSLVPLKKVSTEKRSNNVISRNQADLGYIFSPAVLTVRQGREFSFEIVNTGKNAGDVAYKITSFPDWLEMEKASGTFSEKVKISGKAKDKVLSTTVSLDGKILVDLGGNSCELPVRLTF